MTEEEWKKEARRVAIAFDFSSDCKPIQLDYHVEHNSYRAVIEIDDFRAFVWFDKNPNTWEFSITSAKGDAICCSECCADYPNDTWSSWRGNHWQYTSRLVRAMIRLGFDTAHLETRFNLSISAHEKLEWQLEFARRMREDARENGA